MFRLVILAVVSLVEITLASAIKRIQVIYDRSQPIIIPITIDCIEPGIFQLARQPEVVIFEGEMLPWPSSDCHSAILYTFSTETQTIFKPLIECSANDGVGYSLAIQETSVASPKNVDVDQAKNLLADYLEESGPIGWPLAQVGILTIFDRCFHYRKETLQSVEIRCCGGKLRRAHLEDMRIGHFYVLKIRDRMVDISASVQEAQALGSGVCLVIIDPSGELSTMFLGQGEQTNRLTFVLVSQDV